MRIKSHHVVVACLALLLVGCTAMSGYPEGDPAELIVVEKRYLLTEKATQDYDKSPSISLRNRIVLARMAWVDQHFRNFEKALHQETLKVGVGMDWLLLAITGATATIGGETFKSALGAVATGIQGAQSSFDKQVFREKSLAAILAHMKAQRAERALAIRKGLEASLDAYPLESGLADLGRYYEAGTLPEAFGSLVETANVKKNEAEAELKVLLDDTYGYDSASQLLEQYLYPSGIQNAPDAAHRTNIENCIQQNNLPTGPGAAPALITGGDPKTARARTAVAVCLGLI